MYEYKEEKFPVSLTERIAKKNVMFIVPEGAPPSSYAPEGFQRFKAFTRVVQTDPEDSSLAISYVTYPADDKGRFLALAIYTELAQNLIKVIPDGLQNLSEEQRNNKRRFLQEVIANGLGRAMSYRYIGMDYDYYREDASGPLYPSLGTEPYHNFIIPKDMFEDVRGQHIYVIE